MQVPDADGQSSSLFNYMVPLCWRFKVVVQDPDLCFQRGKRYFVDVLVVDALLLTSQYIHAMMQHLAIEERSFMLFVHDVLFHYGFFTPFDQRSWPPSALKIVYIFGFSPRNSAMIVPGRSSFIFPKTCSQCCAVDGLQHNCPCRTDQRATLCRRRHRQSVLAQ